MKQTEGPGANRLPGGVGLDLGTLLPSAIAATPPRQVPRRGREA